MSQAGLACIDRDTTDAVTFFAYQPNRVENITGTGNAYILGTNNNGILVTLFDPVNTVFVGDGTNPATFTVPQDGVYHIIFQVTVDEGTSSINQAFRLSHVQLHIDGTVRYVHWPERISQVSATFGALKSGMVDAMISLTTGQEISFSVIASDQSSNSVHVDGNGTTTFLTYIQGFLVGVL